MIRSSRFCLREGVRDSRGETPSVHHFNGALRCTSHQAFGKGRKAMMKRRAYLSVTFWALTVFLTGGPGWGVRGLFAQSSPQPITNALVLHLSFDGDFLDASGQGNHASAVGSPAIVPGLIGSNSVNVYSTDQGNNYLTLGVRPDLSLGTATDFTVAFWARLPDGAWSGDAEYGNPTFIGNRDNSLPTARGWNLSTGADGRFQWTYRDKNSFEYDGPAGTFGNSVWHHIVLAVQRGSSDRTYVDGLLVNSKSRPKADGTLDSGLPVNIGNDGTGNYPTTLGAWINPYGQAGSGLCLDDLGIWRRALSTDEVGAIYNAGLLGKNLRQATLADLAGGIPPRITVQPVNAEAVAGSSVSLGISVTGSQPLGYQWRKDGQPIAGAVASVLLLTNVDVPDAGAYSVLVTNLAGADNSIAAQVNVTRSVRETWHSSYDGAASKDDFFAAVKTDAQGNVYMTGRSAGDGTGLDIITAKYGANGDLLWAARYDGPSNKDDSGVALALDAAGNVIVTGSSAGADDALDMVTIKYDANGNRLWLMRYEAETKKPASPSGLAVDSAGNVYVTGTAQVGTRFGYATVKYNSSGTFQWASRYVGPANEEDRASAIAVDSFGNSYVTGKSKGVKKKFDYATVKYDAGGHQLWAARYDGPTSEDDEAVQLAFDLLGNVYVTGSSKGSGTDFDLATVAYTFLGTQLWVARYNAPTNKGELAAALRLDSFGNIIVAGSSKQTGDNLDFITLKYSPLGALLWKAVYDGPVGGEDQAQSMVLDAENNIYVSGSSKAAPGGRDFATVKYTPTGERLWVARYNGSGNGDDIPRGIALSSNQAVVVCGESRGAGTGIDGFVVWYDQPRAPIFTTQPQSQSAAPGADVTFTAAATGTQPLSWQWRVNGVNLSGATNSTLVLHNVLPQQSGLYQVVVGNVASSVISDPALLTVVTPLLGLTDLFAGSALGTTLSGFGQASNVGATREAGEPRIAGRIGGKSVWFTWRAPASGIVSLSTAGTDFDTLLGVYTGSNVQNLTLVAADDDSGGFLTSKVVFNAVVGTEYHISVDGLNGASGTILLSWLLEVTTDRIPVITSLSAGETVGPGASVTYSVQVDLPNVTFQWYHNGELMSGSQLGSLSLANIQPADVGLYYVRVQAGPREVLSNPVYLQINNTDGAVESNVAALDKFVDSLSHVGTSLGLQNGQVRLPPAKANAPSRGYSGTQIFSTYGGSTENGEPSNCGIPGGASAWFAYQAPISGTLYVNTDGSDFDTTLGVYGGDGSSFDTLVNLGCDNNSGANGLTSALRISVTAGTTYYISVDGVNGASGRVVLNYSVGDPPVIVSAPESQVVQPGAATTLSVAISGTSPYVCEWRFNGNVIAGATQSTLAIQNAQPEMSGNYSVVVSNLVGLARSPEALITVADTLPPASAGLAATQVRAGSGEIVDVRNGIRPTVPGAVSLSIAASDSSGLAARPFLSLINGSTSRPATFLTENPAGQFNYSAIVPADLSGVTWTVVADASDSFGNSSSSGVMTLTVPPPVTVSGRVVSWGSGRPLKDVSCQASGSIDASVLSGADGAYALQVSAGGNYTLLPVKTSDTPPASGVTTLDIALVRRHVLSLGSLDSPYKLLAADVNGSRSVSTLDISLMRRIILGMASSFPAGLWRFVPAAHVFSDSRNPWSAPASQSLNNVVVNAAGRDFIAVKLGDVNNSWVNLSAPGTSAGAAKMAKAESLPSLNGAVVFEISRHEVAPGERVTAKITVSGFREVTTTQFSLNWDPAILRFVSVGDFGVRGLSEDSFGGSFASDGKLAISWDDPEGVGVTLPDRSTLATVTFEVVGKPGSSSFLRFADVPTLREASVDFNLASFTGKDGQVSVGEAAIGVIYQAEAGQGLVTLSIPATAEVSYVLEFTDSLTDPSWKTLTSFTGDGTVQHFTDAATSVQRYYRLRSDVVSGSPAGFIIGPGE